MQQQNLSQILEPELLEALKQHFSKDNYELIVHQLKELFNIINVNNTRYSYSKDYRDGIDEAMKLILSGKFVINQKEDENK